MRLGQVVEAAIWINGEETPEDRRRFESDATQAITDLCSEFGFLHGPVTLVEKRPGDDRVPKVPDHIQGQRVRLLVAEAEVVARKPEETPDSLVANLETKDLEHLRKITRAAHQRQFPNSARLTDEEADAVIEEAGPDAAIDALRRHRMH